MGFVKRQRSTRTNPRRGGKSHTGKVRIIAGEWRGRHVAVPPRPQLRPTPNRLRETLFSWLGDGIQGSRVLDLYAGSGVLGFESLSRGADHATFVECDRRTLTSLRKTCEIFDLSAEKAVVTEARATSWLARNSTPWDLVFLDPPFHATREYQRVLGLIGRHLSSCGVVYVESSSRNDAIDCGLEEWKTKEIGEVRIQLFKNNHAEAGEGDSSEI